MPCACGVLLALMMLPSCSQSAGDYGPTISTKSTPSNIRALVLELRGGGDPEALFETLNARRTQQVSQARKENRVKTAGLGKLQFGNIEIDGQQVGMVYEQNVEVSFATMILQPRLLSHGQSIVP